MSPYMKAYIQILTFQFFYAVTHNNVIVALKKKIYNIIINVTLSRHTILHDD